MAAASNNVQLTCTDGSVGAAFFANGRGVSVSHKGNRLGDVSEADLRALADRDGQHAGAAVADKVIALLPVILNDASLRTLIGEADRWSEEHF